MKIDIDKIVHETIDGVVKKYLNKEEDIISPWRDKGEEEFYLPDELNDQLEKIEVPFAVEVGDAFDSCGYSCTVVVVAWFNQNDNKVNTTHLLMEVC